MGVRLFLGLQPGRHIQVTKGGKSWVRTSAQKPSPLPSPESNPTGSKKRARQSNADERNQRAAQRGREVLCDLPQVDFDDLVVGEKLGIGRNGSLFKVKWNGEDYALKQFDVGKDGTERFENELKAYIRAERVWGRLVPRPYFLSESVSGGVKLLGLQLGSEIDDSCDRERVYGEWKEAHKTLERDFGIIHNDAERGKNSILIEDGKGSWNVAIINFES